MMRYRGQRVGGVALLRVHRAEEKRGARGVGEVGVVGEKLLHGAIGLGARPAGESLEDVLDSAGRRRRLRRARGLRGERGAPSFRRAGKTALRISATMRW